MSKKDMNEVIALHVSKEMYPKITAKAEEWDLGIQETIIRILRESLEQNKTKEEVEKHE